MLLSIEGEEATAKTTILCTAPKPLVVFGFDLGAERALYGGKHKEYFEDLDIEIHRFNGDSPEHNFDHAITVFELPQPVQLTKSKIVGCLELWEYFIGTLARAAQDSSVMSIGIDTATLARRVRADAYLQELQEDAKGAPRKQLLQIEWGHPNDSIRNIYTLMAGLGKNLITTHHLTDEYKDYPDGKGGMESKKSGSRLLEGLSQTHRFVDIAVRTRKLDKSDSNGSMIKVEMRKCGYNLSLEGVECGATWNDIVGLVMTAGYSRDLPTA